MPDFIEPYGQAMLGNAADRVLLPGYLPLQEGVNTLMVTGAEDMRLQLLLFNGSTWNSLIEFWWIPQGTKTYVHTIGVRAGETRTVSLAAPNTDLSDGHRATIQVVATPLYGAGGG